MIVHSSRFQERRGGTHRSGTRGRGSIPHHTAPHHGPISKEIKRGQLKRKHIGGALQFSAEDVTRYERVV